MMTLSEKREKQKVIIDELYALTEQNAPENNEGSFLYTKFRELMKLEMEYYGIKFESADEEVKFEIIYNYEKPWVGNFNEEAEIVNRKLIMNTPKLYINFAYPGVLNIFGDEVKYRLKALRFAEATLFHEVKHFRQFLMQRSEISNREALLSAKESLYIKLKGPAYNSNHERFGIEADAEIYAYIESGELGITEADEKDLPLEYASKKELGILLVPGVGFVDRDEFLHSETSHTMASNPDARLFRELYTILKKEYRPDLKKRSFSELLTNYKKEIKDVNTSIQDGEKRSILVNDIHDMYMEIFKRKVLEENPVELYEAVREHGLVDVKRILFSLQAFNNNEKRRRLDAINRTDFVMKKEAELMKGMPINEGYIVNSDLNDGSIIDAREHIYEVVSNIEVKNENIKKFLLSRPFYATIPIYGHFNLKNGKYVSIKDFIEKFLIQNLEKVPVEHYYIMYVKVIKELFKNPYEMDTMYANENANRQYQTLNNQINRCLELPFIKDANAFHAQYSLEELNMMSMIYKVCANDHAALSYFVPPFMKVDNGFVRKFSQEQIEAFVELFKAALRLNKDKFFNPNGISYYEKLYNHPKIITLKEEMEYQVGYGVESEDDEEMEMW